MSGPSAFPRTAGLVGLTLLLSASAVAAQTDGVIRGVVTNAAGRPVSAAVILLEATSLLVSSGGDGRYELTGVSPGSHTITAIALGYADQSRNADLDAGETVQLDFALEGDLLLLEETVVVSATV
ncbi:MAG: carboxypeptidase-like regulatory domain-containing protein, partial [Planctomycetota bacterium]